MRFLRSLLLCGILASTLSASAQARKNNARPAQKVPTTVSKPTTDVRALVEHYDWPKAISALQSLIKANKDAAVRDSLERLLHQVRRAEEMMGTTQQIVFIDSVVVAKSQLLSSLKLSEEAGRMLPTSQVFPQRKQVQQWSEATFVNPLATTAIYAAPAGQSQRLQSVYRAGNGWTAPTVLAGIDSVFVAPESPFLLSDGTTLYFAAKGAESIGGMDIFVTRYNPETRQYVKPNNVGMPFNSPANEYLYAVDPTTGMGILATDRRQPEGKVCIYTFLVPTERKDYDSEQLPVADLRQFAQIASIGRTQVGQAAAIKSAKARAKQQTSAKAQTAAAQFRFVVSDAQVCRSETDFKNKEARALVAQWHKVQQQMLALQQQCDAAELAYSRQRSATLREQLSQLSAQLQVVQQLEKALAQQIRQLELGN